MYHLFRKSTISEIFDKQYRKNPQKVMLICKNVKWTFEDVFKYSNQVANVFHNYGFSKGDEVILNMEGRPESIAIALGLSKIGVITAFINNNLKGESLLQCINKINANAVIYDQSTEPG
jgi:PREDICTED: similar to fatty acid (long chain) transport protein CG7400-PA, isoform A